MKENSVCPVCYCQKIEDTTTFTVDLDTGVIVVRHVPALVCNMCGVEWVEDSVAEVLEKIIDDVRRNGSVIEVKEYDRIAS